MEPLRRESSKSPFVLTFGSAAILAECTGDEISRQMWQQVNQQRVQHIVTLYQLAGDDCAPFNRALEILIGVYVAPLIELALVETLVDCWLTVPIPRGLAFLHQVQERLHQWESQPIISTLTPAQFHQVTGLDPAPVFGSDRVPSGRITVQG